ncbi:hypothetical protein ABEB36_001044 [Hypothenemus hampei]|uniref:RRM domain-containing protein n=1 Tax=Hypothenemus hampei TaxID=57062 RepID=A0ABD1FDA8_HYPHA
MASSTGRLYKLYVSNIPWTVSHSELRQYFSKYGPVNLATVIFDKNTGLSRNFGFVFFGNRQGFEEAQKLIEHKLEGQVLKVAPSTQDQE